MARRTSTKKRIVEAAWNLFREKGYDDTTIEDIITASGTSKGTFYHYFEGKDALLESLSDLFDDYYEQIIPTLDPEMNTVDMLGTLCHLEHQMIGRQIQINVLAYLYSSQVVTKGDKHLLNPNRYYYQLIRRIAETGIQRGEIRSDMSVEEVAKYYSMCERAIIYEYCINEGSFDLGEFTRRTIPTLLEGLRAKHEGEGLPDIAEE